MGKAGFRKLDNDLFLELMAVDLTRSGYKVVLAVIHNTIGWQRQSSPISLSEFTRLTLLSRQGVVDAIKQLQAQGVIGVERRGTPREPTVYSLCPHTEWLGRKAYLTTNEAKTLPGVVKFLELGSQVLESATQDEKKIKEIKERGTGGTVLVFQGATPPMTPGIPMIPVNHPIMGERALEVDSFPGRGAPGTIPNPLPSHTLTHEGLTARIVAFLSGNGGSQSVAAICQALGEPFGGKRTQLVRNALCKAGKRGLVENTARGLWGLPGVTSER